MGEEAAHDTTRRLSDVIPGRFGDPVSVQYAWMSPENAEAMPTRPLFLALHGWGSNERDIAGIMQYIAPYNDVVSLRAPLVLHAPEGVSAGAYSWFHDAVPSGDDLDHDIAAAWLEEHTWLTTKSYRGLDHAVSLDEFSDIRQWLVLHDIASGVL